MELLFRFHFGTQFPQSAQQSNGKLLLAVVRDGLALRFFKLELAHSGLAALAVQLAAKLNGLALLEDGLAQGQDGLASRKFGLALF